jgi:hypothetical protein
LVLVIKVGYGKKGTFSGSSGDEYCPEIERSTTDASVHPGAFAVELADVKPRLFWPWYDRTVKNSKPRRPHGQSPIAHQSLLSFA